jgi:starch synthase (maltosyl-transferring)
MASKTSSRIVIEHLHPSVDGGRYAVKRCVGDTVAVSAEIFRDGHDLLSASVRYRHVKRGKRPWNEVPLAPVAEHPGDVRWSGEFEVDQAGSWEYEINAWVDRFGTWRDELQRKLAAAQTDITGEISEGRLLLTDAQSRATKARDIAGAAAIEAVIGLLDTEPEAALSP